VAEAPARSAEVQQLEKAAESAKAESVQLRSDLTKAEARVRELEAQASAAEPAPPEPAVKPESAPEPPPKKPTLDEIRAALQKNSAASAQIQALTEMMFAELFNGLQLDPETKAALRQLLLDEQMEEIALAQYAMRKGDVPWNEVAKWREDERAALDQQMQALLSAEAYKTWHDYATAIDDRTVEVSLRNQIRAFASGLTDENFEIVMTVALDEFRAEQQALERSNTLYTAAENMNYQIRAMEAMRERLQQALPADQLAEIENWLTMGTNLFKQQLAAMTGKA
jgi:hypothetical protein